MTLNNYTKPINGPECMIFSKSTLIYCLPFWLNNISSIFSFFNPLVVNKISTISTSLSNPTKFILNSIFNPYDQWSLNFRMNFYKLVFFCFNYNIYVYIDGKGYGYKMRYSFRPLHNILNKVKAPFLIAIFSCLLYMSVDWNLS